MGFLRRSHPTQGVPAWAEAMDADEYGHFRELTDDWLRTHSQGFREMDGGGIEVDFGEDMPFAIELANLAAVCHALPRAEWPREIELWLDGGRGLATSEEEPTTLAEATSMVKVRIYPDDYLDANPGAREWLVARPVAPGLQAVLVLDYPDIVRNLRPELAEGWGASVDDLFDLGLKNVREQDRPEIHTASLPNGGEIVSLLGESFFTATWLLMPDEYLKPASPHGALVAVPNRHELLFHSIVDLSVLEGCTIMLEIAALKHRDGPGSISPNLYWRQDDRFTLLPSRRTEEGTFFEPPSEFVALLNQLARGSGAA